MFCPFVLMKIVIYNLQKDLSLSTLSVRRMVRHLLKNLNVETEEVILYFVSKKKICEIHEQFFSDPSPTDCISFPIDPPNDPSSNHFSQLLGEVFVCPFIANEYASLHNLDPYEETKLYIIHGLLHLLGYDDLDPKERSLMRKMEKDCLEILKGHSIRIGKKRLF